MLVFIQAMERKMPAAIPVEVRKKIVSVYEKKKMTQAEIAEAFDTTDRTVCRFVSKVRSGEGLAVKKQTGRPSYMNPDRLVILKNIVLEQPDKTLIEYCNLFQEKTSVSVSRSSMDRFLKILNLGRKKKSLYAQEQDRLDVKKKRRLYVRVRK